MAGQDRQQDVLAEFVHRIQEWRWPEALKALQADVMLVTDADIGEALQEAYGPLGCTVSTPESYAQELDAQTKKLIFLCRTGERKAVKAAQEKYPECEVFSATYDLAPVSILSGGYFEWSLPGLMESEQETVLIFATPGSDVDYFRHLLSENGFCHAHEYINRTVAAWAQMQSDFEVFRFLSGVRRKHGQKRLALVLYTDVLFDLLANSRLTLWRLGNMLKARGTKAIYFTRRDKSIQGPLLYQLHNELGRSFWAQGHLAQPMISDPLPDNQSLDQIIRNVLRAESILEPMLSRLPKYKNLTLEEVVESPAEVLEAMSGFLGVPQMGEPLWPQYDRPYCKRPNLLRAAANYKKYIPEKLGLVRNDYGSFVERK